MNNHFSNPHTTRDSRRAQFVLLLLFLLLIFASVLQAQGFQDGNRNSRNKVNPDGTQFVAFVVAKSAKGFSYWEDRERIMEMGRLETIEEMKAFVERYEPPSANQKLIANSLTAHGFTVVAQDNLFTVIVGTAEHFAAIVEGAELHKLMNDDIAGSIVKLPAEEMSLPSNLEHLVEGMIIQPLKVEEKNTVDTTPGTKTSSELINRCPVGSIQPGDVARSLKLDRVHDQGLRGKDIDIAFIDDGLFDGHDFFLNEKYAVDMTFYEFTSLHGIQSVPNTFEAQGHNNHGSGHGFMVAAYLASAAPDARLHAFARPSNNVASDNFIATYLVYMRANELADVISLSLGWWEEDNQTNGYLPEIRTEFINLMAERSIVLVAGGNSGQNHNNFTSGHNSMAAIPEVLAIGGATLLRQGQGFGFEAAGGYNPVYPFFKGIKGAASFDSILFSGRHVPDVVGVFGNGSSISPSFCYPWPDSEHLNGYRLDTTNGTSGATPQVAGMAAILKQQHPWLSQPQVRSILQSNSFDILTGESGDGDLAGPGYDAATGYGIPMATWATQSQVSLESGWNLIGLTTNKPYSAVGMLAEIYDQGGSCDSISYWSSSHGRYLNVIVDEDGNVYGSNFDIEPNIGYWIRCESKTVWQTGGNGFIAQPQTVQFRAGWNSIAVPYSDVSCTSGDLYHGTGAACYRILRYDGMMQQTQPILLNSGREFLLHPGEGYLVFCDADINWTPVCNSNGISNNGATSEPPPNSQPESVKKAELIRTRIENAKLRLRGTGQNGECAPVDGGPMNEANITDQQFTANWVTNVPCMGSVVLLDEQGNPILEAFDDRGDSYSGVTHHVTVRGLEPNTKYTYGLFSGEDWYDANAHWLSPFTVTTGNTLSIPGNRYSVHGYVVDLHAHEILDGYIKLLLDGDGFSGHLSFPLGADSSGYLVTLDNARKSGATEYYDFLAADEIAVQTLGNAGISTFERYDVTLANRPNVALPVMVGDNSPPSQVSLQPSVNTVSFTTLNPTLQFKATDQNSAILTYRLEISEDAFTTVSQTYDQRLSSIGWSASSYTPGQMATFQFPDPLENLGGYHWRVFAYDGESWSAASDIGAFSILIPIPSERNSLFLPAVLSGAAPIQ